jgi:hypothetical protein
MQQSNPYAVKEIMRRTRTPHSTTTNRFYLFEESLDFSGIGGAWKI